MRSFKKIAAMIMAVAMLCSFTAFAVDTPVISEIAEITTENPVLNLSYTSDAAQDTILVYAGEQFVGANVVYIDQIADGSSVPEIILDEAGPFGKHTVLIGGTDIDRAGTAEFNYVNNTPKCKVTLNTAVNGTVSYEGSLENVDKDTKIAFTIVPYLGYKLSSLMVGEDECVNDVENGVYTLTVTADVTVTPVFTAVAADAGESYTYAKMFDMEADAEDPASKLTFGQATEKADATITSMGMYVKVWSDEANDYVDFYTTGEEHYGPKFAAANWTTDYKYGIRFFGFEQGTYKVWSYVDYSDGTSDTGAEIVFTVE